MNCQQVQLNLSLYLYGELEFRQEEEVEQHLTECALCQTALAREKSWHTSLNAVQLDVPLALLAECRQDLSAAVGEIGHEGKVSRWRWSDLLSFRPSTWSLKVAVASFLLFVGFRSGQWVEGHGRSIGSVSTPITEASLINSHIRDIQPNGDNHVRIVWDQVEEKQITGGVADAQVRQLLLKAAESSADPGIRVDSVEILNGQTGADIREALLGAVRRDSNVAVRLKALDGLRQFADDAATRNTLEYVLEHDESPEVRSQAIDVLAPANRQLNFTPDLIRILQGMSRSQQEDEYVRDRCFQILHEMKDSSSVY